VEGDHVNVFLDLDTMTVEALLPLDQNDDSWLDTDEVEAGQELLLEYLDTKLALSGNDGESETWKTCLPRAISNLKVIEAGRIEFDRVYDCSVGIEALRIRNATFMEDRGGHTFVADVTLGEKSEHLSFFRDQPAYQLGPGTDPFAQELDQPKSGSPEEDLSSGGEPSVEPSSVGAVSLEYLWQGLLHIWTGIDHILFVLSLLLVIRRWKDVGLLVTSFTVAHSITLILGTLEIVPVEQWLGTVVVECAIALSIGYVAIENLWEVRGGITKTPSGSRRRLGLTFLFGLMHGFGFSSLLREFGLPSDALAPASCIQCGSRTWSAGDRAPGVPSSALTREATPSLAPGGARR